MRASACRASRVSVARRARGILATVTDLASARCAVHPDRAAPLACFRCGTFACEECSPSPSVLCPECVARIPTLSQDAGRWAVVPPRPYLLRRLLPNLPLLLLPAAVALRLLSWVWPALVPVFAWSFWLTPPILLLWGIYAFRHRTFSRGLTAARRTRETSAVRAAADLEGLLRRHTTIPILRVAALSLQAALLSDSGEQRRALDVCRRVLGSAWFGGAHAGAGLIATRAHALLGDVEAAARARAGVRLGWRRLFATTADDDALVAARCQRWVEAHSDLQRAKRYAARRGRPQLARWTHLLDAFVLERMDASDAEIADALVLGATTTPEEIRGLTRSWPELADFVARRLPTSRPMAPPHAGSEAER